MTFEEWLAELKNVLLNDPDIDNELIDEYIANTDWTEQFEEGYTPQEAFDEDKSYWTSDFDTSELEVEEGLKGFQYYTDENENDD